MGNVISSSHTCRRLAATELKETGFSNSTKISSSTFGAKIEHVSDESIGKAVNLLADDVKKDTITIDDEETPHGWLTKRHEESGSVTVNLCHHSNVYGFDIDTTGYIECCPSYVTVEGFSETDSKWYTLISRAKLITDSHNFFDFQSSHSFSSLRLHTLPGGGVARFHIYGEIIPNLSGEKIYNLASANLGAQVVRWTDQKSANNKNILLDHGNTMHDGWLTPRSKLGKKRNDFMIIKLAVPGKLTEIVIDTHAFENNSPEKISIQGCFSNDVDPYYAPTKWFPLVTLQRVMSGAFTVFELDSDQTVSHLQLFMLPDGGIQQISAYGYPIREKKKKKGLFLIESVPEIKKLSSNVSETTLIEEESEQATPAVDLDDFSHMPPIKLENGVQVLGKRKENDDDIPIARRSRRRSRKSTQ